MDTMRTIKPKVESGDLPESSLNTIFTAPPLKGATLKGRVLITGGAGYIGRAITRTAILNGWDCSFTIVSRDEQKQAHMKKCVTEWTNFPRQHTHNRPDPSIKYAIMDINDTQRLADVMVGNDLVIHAAALKYIPEAEREVAECLNVNLQGSMSVATAARMAEVGRVVALSTDKATSPLNVYGATKFLMERLYAELDIMCANLREMGRAEPRFTTVRYGNVIGSTGSVIPNFLESLAVRGKVSITHPDMTRFWITYQDAIDIICEAASCPEVGVTVIPKPKAMRLGELAQACIQVAVENEVADIVRSPKGYDDDRLPVDLSDAINIVGLRPGEKMDEALLNEAESMRTIDTGPYYYLLPPGYNNGSGEAFALWSDQVEKYDNASMKLAIRESQLV